MNRRFPVIALLAVVCVVAAIVLWPAGRASGPEPIAYGRDACDHCRMVISRPGFGGEMRSRDGTLTRYDDVGCLLRAIASERRETPEAWVEDNAGEGFVPLLDATFVRGPITTPMGHGIVAFRSEEKARALAASQKAAVVPLETLLAELARGGGTALAEAKPFTPLEAEQGREVYTRECASCHGTLGAGDGPAAAFLDPRPRDFTKKTFKFRTTESGKPPRTEDVLATLERGLPGSAMPSFAFLSPEEKRRAGAYVFKMAGLLGKPEPPAIADPGAPPAFTPELLARGKELFAAQGCVACHGEGGRGDGSSAATLTDSTGRPIKPRDFTTGVFRGGGAPRDVYDRIFTGIDGTPMPAFAESVTDGADRWSLVAYVLSLVSTEPQAPLPADPILAGRAVAEKYGCGGCHVLDDGRGGEVGPPYALAGRKLQPEWIREFLQDPRGAGKIYPWRVHRMPGVRLEPPEIDAMVAYLGKTGGYRRTPETNPDPAAFPADKIADGKNVFVLRCSQCHALGSVVKTPLASQQGPDLANVAGRLDYAWMKGWILDPRKLDPKTKMTVPGITPAEADAVRMFVWKISTEERRAAEAPTGGAP